MQQKTAGERSRKKWNVESKMAMFLRRAIGDATCRTAESAASTSLILAISADLNNMHGALGFRAFWLPSSGFLLLARMEYT
jgi:hypothetical protein